MNHKVVIRSGVIPGAPDSEVLVEGVSVKDQIRRVEVGMEAGKVNDVILYLVRAEVDLEIEGAIYIVQPPDEATSFALAATALRGMDPKMLEEEVLEGLQWSKNQSVIHATLNKVVEILEHASDQPLAGEEVPGSTDDGHSEDHTSEQDERGDVGLGGWASDTTSG